MAAELHECGKITPPLGDLVEWAHPSSKGVAKSLWAHEVGEETIAVPSWENSAPGASLSTIGNCLDCPHYLAVPMFAESPLAFTE